MSPFVRKVKTASGATAVQIVEKVDRQNRVIEHLGSAHTAAELAVLVEAGRQKLNEGQTELDLGLDAGVGGAVVESSRSRLDVPQVFFLGVCLVLYCFSPGFSLPVFGLDLCGGLVSKSLMESLVVPPVNPLEGGCFDIESVSPRGGVGDEFVLVRRVHTLS